MESWKDLHRLPPDAMILGILAVPICMIGWIIKMVLQRMKTRPAIGTT